MELRLAELETPFAADASHHRPGTTRRRPVSMPFLFVTYAFEIEGDAPIIFVAEAVDD